MNIESKRNDFFLFLNFDFYSNYVKQYSGYLMSAFYTLTNTQAHKHFPRSGHLVR